MKVYITIITIAAVCIAVIVDNTISIATILLLSNVFLIMRGSHRNTLKDEFGQHSLILFSSIALTLVIYLSGNRQIGKHDYFFLIITFHALYSFNSTCSFYFTKILRRIKNKLF